MSKSKNYPQALGLAIAEFDVYGKEHDLQERWVGADVMLKIPPIGNFSLTVTTRIHFIEIEEKTNYPDNTEVLERLLNAFPGTEIISKPPYLIDYPELSEIILEDNFKGKTVTPELANSLWYSGSI